MSEIRDRAKAAPAKSRKFRDGIFPASGKKFRSVSLKPPVSSAKERRWTELERYIFVPFKDPGEERNKPKQCRARNGNVPFKNVQEKNSVPLPLKWNFCVCYSFKIFAGIPAFSVRLPAFKSVFVYQPSNSFNSHSCKFQATLVVSFSVLETFLNRSSTVQNGSITVENSELINLCLLGLLQNGIIDL